MAIEAGNKVSTTGLVNKKPFTQGGRHYETLFTFFGCL